MQILACGTSYHAGLVARHWIEALAGLPCQVEVASEFRYRQSVTLPNTLVVGLSQSGETADTLAALEHVDADRVLARLAICNVDHSALVRASELVYLTQAGTEIGVASTKAFTTQLAALSEPNPVPRASSRAQRCLEIRGAGGTGGDGERCGGRFEAGCADQGAFPPLYQ